MMDLGLTFTDIDKMLRAFPDLSDISADVSEMIDEENAILSIVVCMQGIPPTEVSATKHVRLRTLARMIVKNRVAARIQEQFSHERSKLSADRRLEADNWEAMIRNNTEAITDDYDPKLHRGTWDFDDDDQQSAHPLSLNWDMVNGG